MEKKLFSYIRVSTAKQGEHGVSLQEQNEAIQRYATRQSLSIVRSFEEQETAAKRGRPVFSEMLQLLRKGAAQGVVIHKIDRGARNLKDWADLAELIDLGVEVHFANESLDLNTRGGRLSADIQAVVAADYIRNLREETKKGFYGRLKQGLYPIGAPIGYLDSGGGQPKIPDPKMAPLVREAFDLYATGNYSLPRLVVEMNRRGLRNRPGKMVSLNGLSTILNNPFYTGVIRIKKTGESYPGIHAPIVSTHLFEAVHQILHGKTVPRTRRHEFTFSRMIRCALCGRTVTAEVQKGHTYYRCHTQSCATKSVREERINSAVESAFQDLTLSAEELSYIEKWFSWARANQQTRIAERIEAARLRLAQVRERLARLTDAYLDGTIDKVLHSERRSQLLVDENSLKRQLHDLESGTDESVEALQKFFELVKTASMLYKLATPAEKRIVVKKLTSNLRLGPENPVITLRKEAQMIADRPKLPNGSPNRGVLRTWSPLLQKLVEQLEHKDFLAA